jgi:hypothetical protein
MTRIYWIAALLPLAAGCAAAQGTPDETKAKLDQFIAVSKTIGPEGMLLNAAVKGAPYAADEVTQFTQTLGDGTHIQREDKVAVYRDGQGRVRRETPTAITIMDPVASVSYNLNPKTMTGRKMTVSIVSHVDGSKVTMDVTVNSEGPLSAEQKARISEARSMLVVTGAADAKAKAELQAAELQAAAQLKAGGVLGSVTSSGTAQVIYKTRTAGEPIGQQMVEGVLCDGTRSVETIAAGAIGNDKPIQTVSERWYSPELKTTVRTVRTDPRTGDETFRLTNIRRGEPDPALFQVPAGYQILGN